ncbi:hypothetical protein IMCC20628_02761 [Hoeflea sp. IMCC20628]|uniref:antitoxin Xre-like helix-turn-helix domain-containing protein n=1 Tax=Hoeflea sp. IMCC20628 TaxID=1620421 RepID=UPI00063BF6A0|nr:antitoxin Xre-like helix-turn-helix domain-containing protein [Hoeflea sp. IMCC20628]AKI01456.1 hypothetical protein IMCC20628_02761 [Hoeflea sp. IMCC20628]
MEPLHTSGSDLENQVSLAAVDPARLARVSATAFSRIVQAWRLGNEAAAQLLDISPRTFARMKSENW